MRSPSTPRFDSLLSRLGFLFERFPQLFRLYSYETPIMSQGFWTAYTPEPVKFSDLRAKTDQQLRDLIHSTLKVA